MSAIDCRLLVKQIEETLPDNASPLGDPSETNVVGYIFSVDPGRAEMYVAQRLAAALRNLRTVGPQKTAGARHDARIALGALDELRRLSGSEVAA